MEKLSQEKWVEESIGLRCRVDMTSEDGENQHDFSSGSSFFDRLQISIQPRVNSPLGLMGTSYNQNHISELPHAVTSTAFLRM